MIIQLSSGQGPLECEYAVGLLYLELKKEYHDIKMISHHRSTNVDLCYSSILFETESDLSELEGSIQWICKSPFRKNHKRKNWFVDVSVIPDPEDMILHKDESLKIDLFHCGGNGGQNVNKVETGVRITHIPTGIVVTSTSERSQLLNKKDAIRKLNEKLKEKQLEANLKQVNDAWREHTRIVRGNPTRVYQGMEFRRKK